MYQGDCSDGRYVIKPRLLPDGKRKSTQLFFLFIHFIEIALVHRCHFFESYHYKTVSISLSRLLLDCLSTKMYRIFVALVFSCAYASFLDGDLELSDGVKLVSVPVSNNIDNEGRSFGDHSVLYRMAKFLQGHELQVKLPTLIEKEKITQVFSDSLKAVDETYKESNGKFRYLLVKVK